MRICHITTVHRRFDPRIFHKECKSLFKKYNDIHLIVADGLGNEIVDGIQIHDIGKPKGRIDRIFKSHKIALKKAIQINANIYHFHDPELLRICKTLKKHNYIVFYDSHEDVPRQILDKSYLTGFTRRLVSAIFEKFENNIVKRIDGVVAATPYIRDRFLKVNVNTIDINNYPLLSEIQFQGNWIKRSLSIGYIGGISKSRGILETLDAIKDTKIKFLLAGKFFSDEIESIVFRHPSITNVEYLGFLNRNEINELLAKIRIGIVILGATPNHVNSLPVKLFEYMAAGVPVLASNFPLWRNILEEVGCGITVDQTNPKDIKRKILDIINDTEKLKIYGENGRRAVEEKYNWTIEENKLYKLYSEHTRV